MTFADSSRFSATIRALLPRLGAAAALAAAFGAAYALTVGIILHQAALLSQPGDRLIVLFAPGTEVAAALEQLGSAGSVLSGTTGVPWFYQADVIDSAAAQRLAQRGLVLRIPQEPTLSGCFSVMTDQRR
jgi:hypothetical protein